MLPGGFIHWGNNAYQVIIACPFVEKMEQYAGDQGQDAECDLCIVKLFL